jgi:hypothetical protein
MRVPRSHLTGGVNAKKIKIRQRIFMTATERVLRGKRDDVLSMDNEKDYGIIESHTQQQ